MDLPRPTVQPPVPVVLGGEVGRRLSDAYLMTAMIYPSYQLVPYPRNQITSTSGGVSRMPNYADRMTVRQMIDVVAFLQSRYVVRKMVPEAGYRGF
jgi:sulfur-oxidizing protein SoxX